MTPSLSSYLHPCSHFAVPCLQQEFSTLPEDAKIYKANGPLLLQQTLAEASDLVDKRLAFITAEIDRTETKLKELESKGQRIRSEILTLSNEPVKQQA